MGKLYLTQLGGLNVYCCSKCKSHIANKEEIISKQFQGRSGKAYLFASVVNVCLGDPEDRVFNSGEYNVRDVICLSCLSIIGWRYEKSYEDTQAYKEGKFILEKARINKLNKST